MSTPLDEWAWETDGKVLRPHGGANDLLADARLAYSTGNTRIT